MRIKPIVGQFIFLLVLSVGLMFLDHLFQGRNWVKQQVNSVSRPIYQVIDFPAQMSDWMVEWFNDRRDLVTSREQLQLENAILKVKLQQLQTDLRNQSTLKSFSSAARSFADKITPADILRVNLERQNQRIILNKGQKDKIYLGQPVVDQFGIVGQITELSVAHSIATLITDASQSTPVLIKRNKLRALAYGTGDIDLLEVKYQGAQSDIKVGDQLISSGIGYRYPAGYPVATVDEIISNPNEAFLQISARPMAQLNHGDKVLLIWPKLSPERRNPHSDTFDQALSLNQVSKDE